MLTQNLLLNAVNLRYDVVLAQAVASCCIKKYFAFSLLCLSYYELSFTDLFFETKV